MLVESLLHMVYYRIFYLPHQFSAAIQTINQQYDYHFEKFENDIKHF